MQRTIGYHRLRPRTQPLFLSMASSISTSARLDLSLPHVGTVQEGAKSFDKTMFRKFLTVVGAEIPALKTGEVIGNSVIRRYERSVTYQTSYLKVINHDWNFEDRSWIYEASPK